MCALAKAWLVQRWPIVCVQETWLCPQTQYAVELALSTTARQMFRSPYQAFWSHCSRAEAEQAGGEAEGGGVGGAPAGDASPSQPSMTPPVPSPVADSPSPSQPSLPQSPQSPVAGARRSAGVGILVDSSLLEQGVLQLLAEPQRHASGRIISMRLAWEGHAFTLCCVYLPSGCPAGQRAFISEHLGPLAAAHQDLVVVGDWNWVPDVGLDRFSRPAPPVLPPAPPPPLMGAAAASAVAAVGGGWRRGVQQRHHADTLTAVRFAEACPRLVDVYRRRHPRRAAYTYHSGRAASRLDRFYVSSSLVPHVESCGVLHGSLSDHRAVFLHLRPKRAQSFGRGVSAQVQPRVRLHHCSDRALAADMAVWLQWQLGLPPEGAGRWGAEVGVVAPPPPPPVLPPPDPMPRDDAGLLAWWPRFKRRLAVKARELDARAAQAAAARPAAVAAAAAALAAACARVEAGEEGALPEVVGARRQYAAASRAAAGEGVARARHEWLHAGERPCPLLTALTRPPTGSRRIPCLRAGAGGGLLVCGPLMAQRMAEFFAGISTAPPRHADDEAAVLAALRAEGREVAGAAAVGSPVVSLAEVRAALRAAKQGTAPGPDGLPPYVWRRYADLLAPPLAAVFSAMGRLDQLPAGFTLGVIKALPKPVMPDTADPGCYRPITLLDSDYRLLARVLTTRLGPALAEAIEEAQTAFLPERQIGENIMFLQLLPELLRSGAAGDARSAAVAFLDFQKAYDTVSRPFLFAAMEAMGAGEGLLRWVRLLLSDTRAAADVNGWVSAPVASDAGVRQGCPLSPALYLFVAQALFSYLRSRGHGIQVGGQRLVGAQFADDAEALLPSAAEEHVQPFLASMAVFGRASGQQLNLGKSQLLPVGQVAPPGAGQLVCGLPVVSSATALGMQFSNDAAAAGTDWGARLAGVEACYSRLARLPLSVFGRAFGASGYGVSKLLYHAEFSAWPEGVVGRLERASVKLVDRGLAPASRKRALPGVPSALLAGPPREGGFGLLPWRQHVCARHARWGAWLLKHLCSPGDDPPPPWVVAAEAILRHLSGGHAHPAVVWLAVVGQRDGVGLPPYVAGGATQSRLPEGPLARMAGGLRALGPLVGAPTAQPGAGGGDLSWVWAAPLWGNPLLPGLPVPELALLPGMDSVGGAWGWFADMQPWRDGSEAASQPPSLAPRSTQSRWEAWWQRRLGVRRLGELERALVLDRGAFLDRLTALRAAVPAPWWVAAATVPVGPRPGVGAALAALVGRVGWRQAPAAQDGRAGWLPVGKLTVRAGTALQMGHVLQQRRDAHAGFVAAATGTAAVDVTAEQLAALRGTLSRSWALKWENQHKEVLWRMSVLGVRGAGAHSVPTGHPCPCGGLAAGARDVQALQHHFWSCPVAAAVVEELQRGWQAGEGASAPPVRALLREDVWLLRPPVRPGDGAQPRRMHGGVWMVVCLAALTAMDTGRRALVAMHLEREEAQRRVQLARQRGGGGRQLSLEEAWGLPEPPPAPAPPLAPVAAAKAKARFWSLLADYAELGECHASWASLAEQGHPFLVRSGDGVEVVVPP